MLLLALLAGCSDPKPLEIGFIAGLSGRVADLGIAGRNGAQYVVEEWNRRGGIDGRPIRLIVRDDGHNPLQARTALAELIERGVEAVIGPMTSNIGVVLASQATEAGLLLISPTVITDDLTGRDDLFFRVLGDSRGYALVSATYQYQTLGYRRIAVIYDAQNIAYSGHWGENFRAAFEALGGEIIDYRPFFSGEAIHFERQAEQLLKNRPDAILVISNALDASLLIQQLRKRQPDIAISTSEWAATERLLELGGASVEGVNSAQFFYRESTQPRFVAFREGFLRRFGRQPGFGATAAHDATEVLLQTIKQRGSRSLKASLYAQNPFTGLQGEIRFDRYGDAQRATYLTTIRNGRYAVVNVQ